MATARRAMPASASTTTRASAAVMAYISSTTSGASRASSARNVGRAARSPLMRRTEAGRSAWDRPRLKTARSWPCSLRNRTTCGPMKPVPPMTRTRTPGLPFGGEIIEPQRPRRPRRNARGEPNYRLPLTRPRRMIALLAAVAAPSVRAETLARCGGLALAARLPVFQGEHFVNDAVVFGGLGIHEEVALGVALDAFERLAGVQG